MTTSRFHPSLRTVPNGRTRFRVPGLDPWLQLDRDESRIAVRTPRHQDRLELSGTNEEIVVDRYGQSQDVVFRRGENRIQVDRPGRAHDMEVRWTENQIVVDRPGLDNDVTATFQGQAIDVHHYATNQTTRLEHFRDDVSVRENGYLTEIFPTNLLAGGSWPEKPGLAVIADFAGLEEGVAQTFDRWVEEGLDVDDLVRVSRDGIVFTFDGDYH
jgi:hypothetical protein